MSVTVFINEEYGYRTWIWETGMDAKTLTEWWQNMTSTAKLFFNLEGNLPGWVHQIYEAQPEPPAPGWHQVSENDVYTDEGALEQQWILVSSGGGTAQFSLPQDAWHAHIHCDYDTVLIDVRGAKYRHAGYVPQEVYFKEDYESPAEVAEEWEVALTERTKLIAEGEENA